MVGVRCLCVFVLVCLQCQLPPVGACPSACTCLVNYKKGKDHVPNGKRVECTSSGKIRSISEIHLESMPQDTIILDLQGNEIHQLKTKAFAVLKKLQKLELGGNEITRIEPGAFDGLNNLVKLNLSNNQLSSINSSMFEGLPKLQRLSLSGNQLKTVQNGTFNSLPVLKRLDLSTNKLTCDCQMRWIATWLKQGENRVRISKKTKCAEPKGMEGRSLNQLRPDDLHCEWPLQASNVILKPSQSQVVFEGDKLPFQCQATTSDSSLRIYWIRKGVEVEQNRTAGILVVTQRPSRGLLIHRLVIEHLSRKHNGVWTCRVRTNSGKKDVSVNIVVLSKDTKFCPERTTITNRGTFTWPKTVSNVRISLSCPDNLVYQTKKQAFYRCSREGHWENLNVSQCQYSNEVTRVLKQYYESLVKQQEATVNVTGPKGTLSNIRKYLTSMRTQLPDVDSVKFLANIIENAARHTRDNRELAETTVEFASILMNTADHLLYQAEKDDTACSRVLKAMETIPGKLLSTEPHFHIHTRNIAMEAKQFDMKAFSGATCSAYNFVKDASIGYRQDNFFCNWRVRNESLDRFRVLEASISLPPTLFKNARCLYPDCKSTQLVVTGYRNSKLFPIITRDDSPSDYEVSSPVMSGKIVGVRSDNLTDPVEIHVLSYQRGTDRKAVYWEFDTNDGHGAWRTAGCTIVKQNGNLSVIRCNHLTNFAVLQRVWMTDWDQQPWYSVLELVFKMQPVVYVGCAVLFLCLVPVVISLCSCHSRTVKMPRRQKHSLANLCLSLMLLLLAFVLGIHRTDNERVCQVAGIAIHYFSLCCVFWITITASNMYKKFTKPENPPAPPPEMLQGPLPPCPMLRFYLLGWGIAIIICGITAAVNLNHYVNRHYCFLAWEPSMGAFLAPVGLLVGINCIIFCCIAYIVKGKKPILDDPETEEINETDLANQELASLQPTNESRTNGDSISMVSSVVDLEYRPVSQLRAIAFVLFLYLTVWASAALTIAKPLSTYVSLHYQEIIFSYCFGIMAVMLGLFMLVFYCLARRDVRFMWKQCCSCAKKKDRYTLNSTDSSLPQANGHLLQSRGSLDSSYTNRSNRSNNTNRSSNYQFRPQTSSNVNLVPSQPASVTGTTITISSIPDYPNFYNPRQNGVAKKYWEKSRKLQQIRMRPKEYHQYHSDTDSHVPSDKRNRRSLGNSSLENASVGVMVPVDHHLPSDGKLPNGRPRSGELQNGFSSLGRSSCRTHSPVPFQPGPPIPPSQMPANTAAPPNGAQVSYIQTPYMGGMVQDPNLLPSQALDPHTGLPVQMCPPPGFVYPVASSVSSSNSLPKVARIQSLAQNTSTGYSVPQPLELVRELDGQSQDSQDSRRRLRPCRKRSSGSSMTGHQAARDSGSSRPTSPESEDTPYFLPTPDTRCYMDSCIMDTRVLSKVSEEGELDFLEQLEQRIPSENKVQSPAALVSTETKNDIVNGSAELSASHSDNSLGHKSNSLTRGQRHKKQDKRRSQSSLKSLEETEKEKEAGDKKERPSSIPYAYVNHDYQDKLLKSSSVASDIDESRDPALKELLPQAVEENGHSEPGSEPEGDSEDGVWVKRKAKEKSQKETRV